MDWFLYDKDLDRRRHHFRHHFNFLIISLILPLLDRMFITIFSFFLSLYLYFTASFFNLLPCYLWFFIFAKYLLYIYHLPLANTEMMCFSSLKAKTSIWLPLLRPRKLCLSLKPLKPSYKYAVKPYAISNPPWCDTQSEVSFTN